MIAQTVSHYRIIERLGGGGMDVVYKAQDTTQLTYDEAAIESIEVSRDGRLLVSSDRSRNWDLYPMSASGGDLQQLTTDPCIDAGPRWRPDGREIASYSSRTGRREIWIMPIGGGPARQLTCGEA